jgi:hypothetical protein
MNQSMLPKRSAAGTCTLARYPRFRDDLRMSRFIVFKGRKKAE